MQRLLQLVKEQELLRNTFSDDQVSGWARLGVTRDPALWLLNGRRQEPSDFKYRRRVGQDGERHHVETFPDGPITKQILECELVSRHANGREGEVPTLFFLFVFFFFSFYNISLSFAFFWRLPIWWIGTSIVTQQQLPCYYDISIGRIHSSFLPPAATGRVAKSETLGEAGKTKRLSNEAKMLLFRGNL